MHLKAGREEEERGDEGGWGRKRESGGRGGGGGGRMLQWLCALQSPADAAEKDGTPDWSTSDQSKLIGAFKGNVLYCA